MITAIPLNEIPPLLIHQLRGFFPISNEEEIILKKLMGKR